MMATKIIVPIEIMHLEMEYMERMALLYGENWTNDSIVKKKDQYIDFVRMPFNSILLENESGALYVRKEMTSHPNRDNHYPIIVTHIAPTGFVSPIHVGLVLPEDSDEMFTHCTLVPNEARDALTEVYLRSILKKYPKATLEEQGEMIDEVRTAFQDVTVYTVLEVLLFMNVRNVEQVIYKLARKEKEGIQKSLLPFYEYRVLDIYKTRKEYKSLATLLEDVGKSTKQATHRRTHLVRGHFKNIHGKLFWWNPFMRNKSNILTHGVVEKDYRLKE